VRTVHLVCAPIGLGPLGKAQAFARTLEGKVKTRLVVDRCFTDPTQLCTTFEDFSVMYCPRGAWSEFLQKSKPPDALVSFMEPSAVTAYSRCGIPTVFFDSLVCFDRLEDPRVSECDFFIQQCFATNAAERNVLQKSAMERGFELCAPLTGSGSKKVHVELPERDMQKALIHIGGLGTPYVSNNISQKIGFEIACGALDFLRGSPVQHLIFAGAISSSLQKKLSKFWRRYLRQHI